MLTNYPIAILFIFKAKLTEENEKNQSIYLNKPTLDQFQSSFKSQYLRNITNYILAFFAPVNMTDRIQANTTVIVPNPEFFNKLDKVMIKLERQKLDGKRRMANYIGWHVITKYIEFLPVEYRDKLAEHIWRISGNKPSPETPTEIAERCMKLATKFMPLAMGAMYIRDVVPADLKRKVH